MKCARLTPLKILGRKWSYLIMRVLKKPHTFSHLQKELRFITNRILSRELKLLVNDKLITQHDGRYQLTRAGAELVTAVEPLERWSVKELGLKHCPEEQQCNRCAYYAENVGARQYLVKFS